MVSICVVYKLILAPSQKLPGGCGSKFICHFVIMMEARHRFELFKFINAN